MGPRLAVVRDETRPTVRFAKRATDGLGRCKRCIRRAYADEQVARVPLAPVAQPSDDGFADVHGDRHTVELPAFAAGQYLARAPVDVVESYRNHFLRPQTQAGHQQEHRVIAQIDRAIAADGFEQLLNDAGLEMARQPVRSPAGRSGYGIRQVARSSPAPEEEPQDVAHVGKTPAGPSGVTVQEGEDGFGRDGGQILRRAGGGAAEPNDALHHLPVDPQPIPEHPLVVPEPVVQFGAELFRGTEWRRCWRRRSDHSDMNEVGSEATRRHGEFALHVRRARPRACVGEFSHDVRIKRVGPEAPGLRPRAQAPDHEPEALDGAYGVALRGKGFQECPAVGGQPVGVRRRESPPNWFA